MAIGNRKKTARSARVGPSIAQGCQGERGCMRSRAWSHRSRGGVAGSNADAVAGAGSDADADAVAGAVAGAGSDADADADVGAGSDAVAGAVAGAGVDARGAGASAVARSEPRPSGRGSPPTSA